MKQANNLSIEDLFEALDLLYHMGYSHVTIRIESPSDIAIEPYIPDSGDQEPPSINGADLLKLI